MLSSFDMVGLKDERQGANPMKRLLLMVAAASAIMLTACIDVDLASSAKASDGTRITLISNQTDAGGEHGENTGSHANGPDSRRGDAADTRSGPRSDAPTRS